MPLLAPVTSDVMVDRDPERPLRSRSERIKIWTVVGGLISERVLRNNRGRRGWVEEARLHEQIEQIEQIEMRDMKKGRPGTSFTAT